MIHSLTFLWRITHPILQMRKLRSRKIILLAKVHPVSVCVRHSDLSSVLSGSLHYRVSGHPMDNPTSPSHLKWSLNVFHSFLQVGTFFVISQDSDRVADLNGLEQWFFKSWAVAKILRKKSVTFIYYGQIGLLSMFYFSTVLKKNPLA